LIKILWERVLVKDFAKSKMENGSGSYRWIYLLQGYQLLRRQVLLILEISDLKEEKGAEKRMIIGFG
jgi:hypothetical protein